MPSGPVDRELSQAAEFPELLIPSLACVCLEVERVLSSLLLGGSNSALPPPPHILPCCRIY